MKKLILAAVLAATTMTSAVYADSVKVVQKGWYAADVTVSTDRKTLASQRLLLGRSLTVDVPDGERWTVSTRVLLDSADGQSCLSPITISICLFEGYDQGTTLYTTSGIGDLQVELHGTLYNIHYKTNPR